MRYYFNLVNTNLVTAIILLALPGCANHYVKYDKVPEIQSDEDAIIEYRLVAPYFATSTDDLDANSSPYSRKHIYGTTEQYEFVQGFADILKGKNIFGNVEITKMHSGIKSRAANRIEIDFLRSFMAAPEPVLQLIVRIKIQGKDKVGIANEYHIQSGTRLEAFMDMSSNGKKNNISKRLVEAIIEDLERYFNNNKTEILEYSDISFVPPRGKAWVLIPQNSQNEYDVAIGKYSDSPTNSFYVAMHAEEISQQLNAGDEFAKYASALAVSGYKDNRFRVIESNFELTNRFTSEGIIYHVLIEDSAAPNAKSEISYIEVSGYYFIHPSKKKTLMNVFYSERYLQDEKDIDLGAKGRSFLDSIRVKED